MPEQGTIVISLGGSIICPQKVDTRFLAMFVRTLQHHLQTHPRQKIIIITGGGSFCRQYLAAFDLVRKNKNTIPVKDELGIAITKINAQLLHSLLAVAKAPVHPIILDNPSEKISWGKSLVAIGGGYKPGHSTDYDAVLAAIANGAQKVINLTNIDHVYTSDPEKHPNARPLSSLTWKEYMQVLKIKRWSAGLHTPFDPLASQLAQKRGLAVTIADGRTRKNLSALLHEKQVGTRIADR